jgi:CRISPR/Cas system-associated exonuclease Cas4 (RecB family)
MSILGFACKFGYRSYRECLDCPDRCILITLAQENLEKSSKGYYEPRVHEYHATSLIGCPRFVVLSNLVHTYAKPENMWRMQTGTLFHALREKWDAEHGLVELPLRKEYEIDGEVYTVVGRTDLYDTTDKIICDHKFTRKLYPKYLPKKNHWRQCAIYEILFQEKFGYNPWALGAQINYCSMEDGEVLVYRITGDEFVSYVDEMRKSVPDRLKAIRLAETQDRLPGGDYHYDQCNYCDFRMYCDYSESVFSEVREKILSDRNIENSKHSFGDAK